MFFQNFREINTFSFSTMYVQGDPTQNLLIEMAVTLQTCPPQSGIWIIEAINEQA